MYTNVLHMQRIRYYWRSSFSGSELRASYGPKHASWSLSGTPFCAYFKYNSKTMGCLQLYYTPNDSSTTENALFHVKSGKAVATYKLRPCTNITVLLFCVQVEWQQNSGHLQVYYNTVTTTFLPKLHLLEIQTEVRHTSCCPAAITVSLHYM